LFRSSVPVLVTLNGMRPGVVKTLWNFELHAMKFMAGLVSMAPRAHVSWTVLVHHIYTHTLWTYWSVKRLVSVSLGFGSSGYYCMHVYVVIHTHTHTHIYIYALWTYWSEKRLVSVSLGFGSSVYCYVCINIYMYIYVCVCVYIYIYIYIVYMLKHETSRVI
jgi:hypothetical protein